nr:energy transducer TonB [uncultured Anaeromusa sp.]
MSKSSKKALTISASAHLVVLLVLGYVGVFSWPAQAVEEYLELSLNAAPLPVNGAAAAMPSIAPPSAPAARQQQAQAAVSAVAAVPTNVQAAPQAMGNAVTAGPVSEGAAAGGGSLEGGSPSDGQSAGTGAGGSGGTVPASARVLPPRILRQTEPAYPESLRQQRIEGRVAVRMLVLEDGSVGDANVVSSSGYGEMDEAALDAVRQWQFVPARQEGGGAVRCRTTLSVSFRLRG